MATGRLFISLDAIAANWQALDRLSGPHVETGACVKADGYGLGAAAVATRLAQAGVRRFFVAVAEEGVALRKALGHGPEINVFSGHMDGDTEALRDAQLTPLLNSIDQMLRHVEALPGHAFGIQLDSGMNRLGMEPAEWAALREIAEAEKPTLVMSHLACADEPEHPMNAQQLQVFLEMTQGLGCPRSLAATGGTLLGPALHFDVTRPGIGLYGGLPFEAARPVVQLDLPVIQVRSVAPGETVGYGNTFTATRDTQVATVAAGYADGLIRAASGNCALWAHDVPCPIVGRISMDLITVDVTDVADMPTHLTILGAHQGVDTFATAAGTIGYEVLTSLGARYDRHYS
ncbi:alanine racemase [Pseudaestuariivita sp.]|uniref:alanine racemase n=1 Tax=Pseudaestuariivita sp. TaxID=2211669 RepID=UPI00405885B4